MIIPTRWRVSTQPLRMPGSSTSMSTQGTMASKGVVASPRTLSHYLRNLLRNLGPDMALITVMEEALVTAWLAQIGGKRSSTDLSSRSDHGKGSEPERAR